MKILFDECMPQPLRLRLADFEIHTAQEMGWGRLKNGESLKRAEGVFDPLLTSDQPMEVSAEFERQALVDSGAFIQSLAKSESEDTGDHRCDSGVASRRLY